MKQLGNGNVIKLHKQNNFTTIDNNIFMNKELSLKAKGLLSMMLSFSDSWEFSISGLSKLSKDGIDSVRSGLDELEKQGYLKREYPRESGKFSNTVFNIYEQPIHMGNTVLEKPHTVKPTREIQHNKELSNKVLSNKEITNNKDIVRFEQFWELYPKKTNKAKAKVSFNNQVTNEDTFIKVIKDLEQRVNTKQWQDKQYIPHATTYLNGKRWEDELGEMAKVKTKSNAIMEFS